MVRGSCSSFYDFHVMISLNIVAEQKGGTGTEELKQLKHLSMKMYEVTSNVAITKKTICQANHTARYTRAPRAIFR